MKKTTSLALSLWLFGAAATLLAQTPLKHIRVIIDTTASLHQNDPSGYVKLSTEMLFDLSLNEHDPNDTFKVARFPDAGDPAWPETDTPPERLPNLDKNVITPVLTPPGEADFRSTIRNLTYRSQNTYFSPVIRWAMEDLDASGKPSDNRVIVLITDGQPDTKPEAKDKIQLQQLAVMLREKNIRLFVLAFGKEIDRRLPPDQQKATDPGWFKGAFNFGTSGPLGDVFSGGTDGNNLLDSMLEIFAQSFGFSKEDVPAGSADLDVARDLTLQRAAVVALYHRAGQPDFKLMAPSTSASGAGRTYTEGAQRDPAARAPSADVSYAYQWLTPPARGHYQFNDNGVPPAAVAILRPIRVKPEIRSYQHNAIDVALAGKETKMEVLVSPKNGSGGDPGKDLRVHYFLRYCTQNDNGLDAGKSYPSDEGDAEGRLTSEGRVFVISPTFIDEPPCATAGARYYQAYIAVEVTHLVTPVYRMDRDMQPVRVYPNVHIGVYPDKGPAIDPHSKKEELEARQNGCISNLKFMDYNGVLTAETYTLGVRLLKPPTSSAWNGAKFTFDNNTIPSSSGDWPLIVPISREKLINHEHTFCVMVGYPRSGTDEDVQVHFGIWQNASDPDERKLNTVDDLTMHVKIAPPDLWHELKPWLMLLLGALLLYLLFLLLSDRKLAPDLGVQLYTPGAGALLPAGALATRQANFLGVRGELPVFSLDGGKELGRVRPGPKDIYVFRPASPLHVVSEPEGIGWKALQKDPEGSFLLSAGVTYQTGIGSDVHLFRIEYAKRGQVL